MAKARLQTHRDREKTLDQLQNSLAGAANIFSTKADEVDETNYKRKGALQALIAVCKYLREEKFDRRQVEPLRVLVGALADADDGSTNEIIAVRKIISGAPPRQHDQSAVLGVASAIVTLLMRKGAKLEDAASQVARILNQFDIWVGKSREGNEIKALINWRKKLMAGKQGDVARGAYDPICTPKYKNYPANELLNLLSEFLEIKVP
jgi:hypothetical protein